MRHQSASNTIGEARGAPSDLDQYIASLEPEEQQEIEIAGVAIDLAILSYRARERRDMSQEEAASLAGIRQQTVSRLEQPGANPRLETFQRYLAALGYGLELQVVDVRTGERIPAPALAK